MNDIIKSARLNVASQGGSELKAFATNENLQDLFNKKQKLLAEMNQAKQEAAAQAAVPFLDAISEIDKMYAMMLTLVGDNKDDQ